MVTLTRYQRDTLYKLLASEVYAVTEMEPPQFCAAVDRLRLHLRLLEEIGCDEEGCRQRFTVEMPGGELEALVERLRGQVDDYLEELGTSYERERRYDRLRASFPATTGDEIEDHRRDDENQIATALEERAVLAAVGAFGVERNR